MRKMNETLKIKNEKLKTRGIVFVFVFAFCIFNCSFRVFAHEGKPHHFSDLWVTWGRDPLIIAGLALTAGLYWLGSRRLWRESSERGRVVRKSEALYFAAGWLALFI